MLPLVRISPLEAALSRGLAAGGDLRKELEPFADTPLTAAEDATAVGKALQELARRGVTELSPEAPFFVAAGLLQEVASPDALGPAVELAIPVLLEVFDKLAPTDVEAAARLTPPNTAALLFLLKLLAMFGDRQGAARVIGAARIPIAPHDEMWAVVFQQFSVDHPHRHAVVGRLLDPLPDGVIGLAHLELANRLARANEFVRHPYDESAGRLKLQELLLQQDNVAGSAAAAGAIAYIGEEAVEELLATAAVNRNPRTHLEAAWSGAKRGREDWIETLRNYALRPSWSRQAIEYLKELGLERAIPRQALEPRFAALAELSAWLAHPLEFGRPPDDVELIGEALLQWPPTNDQRTLRLFRYEYKRPHEETFVSLALVGSITFSLRLPPDTPPDDVLALHCCWELAATRDPRAPPNLSVTYGRKLIEEAQSGPPAASG